MSPSPVINQGDIFWVDPGNTAGSEQRGRRPYIIVSRTSVNRAVRTVIGIPLSTAFDPTALNPPFRIVIPAKEIVRDVSFGGEVKDSIAKTDQVRVLDRSLLQNKMGRLTNTAFVAVGLGLAYLFDLR